MLHEKIVVLMFFIVLFIFTIIIIYFVHRCPKEVLILIINFVIVTREYEMTKVHGTLRNYNILSINRKPQAVSLLHSITFSCSTEEIKKIYYNNIISKSINVYGLSGIDKSMQVSKSTSEIKSVRILRIWTSSTQIYIHIATKTT